MAYAWTSRWNVCALIMLTCSAGCRDIPRSSGVGTGGSARGAAAVSVQADREYLEAERRFLSGDGAGALRILERLKRDPLSASDRAFLERQIRIVKGEAGGADSAASRRIPRVSVSSVKDCGPRALQAGLLKLGIRADVPRLRRLAGTGERGTNLSGLAKAAGAYGVRAEGVQMNALALRNLRNPAVAWWGGDHFVALLKIEGDSARIRDPNEEKDSEIKVEELVKKSGGIFLTLAK